MRISGSTIEPDRLRVSLTDNAAGGYVAFEGWIRNQNEGQEVLRLEYEVYEPLAIKEGQKIIAEAKAMYPILNADCVAPGRSPRARRLRGVGWCDSGSPG